MLTIEQECTSERKKILRNISEQELLISKLRRYFLDDKIDLDDFNDLKKQYKELLDFLNEKLMLVNERLIIREALRKIEGEKSDVFALYENQDVAGKRYIIELFTPTSFNPITKELNPLQINQALSLITICGEYRVIIDYTKHQNLQQVSTRVFSDRKISIAQAMKILKKNGINTNEKQTKEILDFLFLLAKTNFDRNVQDPIDNIPERRY